MEQSEPRPAGVRPNRRTFLAASAVAATAAAAAVAPMLTSSAAEAPGNPNAPGLPIHPQPPDPQVRAILGEIDPARIQAIIEQLVAFGTRHTLSSQDDPVRGIGAARDWIFAQMQSFAAASEGRMTVELQSFVQAPGPRIPVPTTITNVIATLRGDVTPDRVYVVSGHYDSRVTDVLNATSDAPGA